MHGVKDGGRPKQVHRAGGAKRTTENGRAARDAREAVLLALLSYEKKDTFSSILVKRTLDDCASMDVRERAFVKRLLEGVIERRTEMDDMIGRFTGRSISRLHPVVLQCLRMGLYQLHYMDAVPDRAACDEAVRLAKRHGAAGLSGFVNAVLRRAAREKEAAGAAETGGDGCGLPVSGSSAGSGVDNACLRGDGCGRPLSGSNAGSGAEKTQLSGDGQQNAVGTKAAETLSDEETASAEGWRRTQVLRYSMPEWLVGMWEEQIGRQQTQLLLGALMEIRPVSIRLRISDETGKKELLEQLRASGADVRPGRWLTDSFRLRRTADLRRLPGFEKGLWTVQDESSMLAVEAAGIRGGEEIFDVCAAPGGKSFLAADRLIAAEGFRGSEHLLTEGRYSAAGESFSDFKASEDTSRRPAAAGGRRTGAGMVHSFDLSGKKTDLIRDGARRLRLGNILVGERDARVPHPEDDGRADILFCDLPCSGLGVIGKKRDIKYRASLDGIRSLEALQREILRNAVRLLRRGGVLIYSTCTISRAENEGNADWIASELGMTPDPLAPHLPAGLPGVDGNRVQLLPHVHGTDGFFIARFRKP